MPITNSPAAAGTVCSLPRRFAAMFYDGLLLFSVWFFATLALLPFTSGEAISSDNLLYPCYLYSIGYLYFAWQWIHGGQTLGMRAWQIRLVTADGGKVTWRSALFRYLLATLSWIICGLGFFMAIPDPDSRSLHDRFSGTVLKRI